MSETPPRAGVTRVDGIFVLGAYCSGLDVVQEAVGAMGLTPIGTPDDGDPGAIRDFNDRLLDVVGGSRYELPKVAPADVARLLDDHRDEARRRFLEIGPGTAGSGVWTWADPRNSVLASFWAEALEAEVACILVHRDPGDAARRLRAVDSLEWALVDALDAWDRFNRAALTACAPWPTIVIRYEELISHPKELLSELKRFLDGHGVGGGAGIDDAVRRVEARASAESADAGTPIAVDSHHRVLDHVLDQLGSWDTGDEEGTRDPSAVVDAISGFYGEDYYGHSYDKSGVPYRRGEKLWVDLMGAIADAIVGSLAPRTVLDVGCATGMLVEALRDRGVDASGIDISTWAIDQVPDALRPYCAVGSVTEELDGFFDVITCSEVLEHLPPRLAPVAIANLCRHSDAVLFSSTPTEFDEPTHLNVQPAAYWATMFFGQGFVHDVDYDAAFLAPHAVLFRREHVEVEELISRYERGMSSVALNIGSRLERAVAEHDRLAQRFNAAAADHQTIRAERDEALREVQQFRAEVENNRIRARAESVAAFEMIRHYEMSERHLAALVADRDAELAAMRQTKIFRYTAKLRKIYGSTRRRGRPFEPAPGPSHPVDGTYRLWIEQYDTLDDSSRLGIRNRLDAAPHLPSISVIMPVFNAPPDLLRAAIESVRGQIFTQWELCIADDASTDDQVAVVLSHYEQLDPRIKVIRRTTNGHISAACNSALTTATGSWICSLDQDDVLPAHALALVALAISERPDGGIVYSDEDKLDAAGERCSPNFKPDFDPLLLLGQNYLNHLCALRRDLVTQVGGYREGFEGSQDWDLFLRVSECIGSDQVVHVPHVLYHWRAAGGSTAATIAAKPYAVEAGRRAVADHLARTGRSGRVTRIARSGYSRVTWELPDQPPLVSIIVPTRDGKYLQRCVESVLALTTYPEFEIVVADNSSRVLDTLQYLRANDGRLKVIRDERSFNYSAINNAAVRQSSGEVVCLLNDDTEVIYGEWLSEMVGQLLQPGVGVVGSKLYYDDGRIQHAGVILGIMGVAGHAHKFFDRLSPGYFGRLELAHNVSAVTAACAAVRRQAWDQVGGLDEQNLAIAFNDVDFCMRVGAAGWRVVWTPHAELMHHESASRGPDDQGPRAAEFVRESEFMVARWGQALRSDRAYNPNLSLVSEDFSLAWPPRVSYR